MTYSAHDTAYPERSAHRMPFGPCPIDNNDPRSGYLFRLWAPAVEEVDLVLVDANGDKRDYRCTRSGEWHNCPVGSARPGDLYAFHLSGQHEVPDPASRFNPWDVHGLSMLTDPTTFAWDSGWSGRPWEEVVIYELHVGTFTREGRYDSAEARLDDLAALGITAIELMPIAEFAGRRGWGYDGVLPFAPEAAYGTPDELKHFIQEAHRRGLMVFLDVVYNHFGPEGNYLHGYAPQFFTQAHQTPWGDAINFDGPGSETVRAFFIHNALYWLEEFHFDGLRLDAVHSIVDTSETHFLEELSRRVRAEFGEERHVHLMLENAANRASYLDRPGTPGRFEAQWNDDFHHAAHVLLTGEHDGYYADFSERPVALLSRCLSEGFGYQGEHSAFQNGPRGECSSGLPASAFVNFLQNHDQVGNRAFGERLTQLTASHKLRALVTLQLLAPSPPLIFMGEESGALTPFLYFCDYEGELARAVREGRQQEFEAFLHFRPGEAEEQVPDPCSEATFEASKLDWDADSTPASREWRSFYRDLLALRRTMVMPHAGWRAIGSALLAGSDSAFEVHWRAADGFRLILQANLGDSLSPPFVEPRAAPFASIGPRDRVPPRLGPWSVCAFLVAATEAPA